MEPLRQASCRVLDENGWQRVGRYSFVLLKLRKLSLQFLRCENKSMGMKKWQGHPFRLKDGLELRSY